MSTVPNALTGRRFDEVTVGEQLPDVALPLTVYRLVMAAGSNRDFNSIHHNTEYARSTGAEEMYANTSFLMSSWERLVRDWCGEAGRIRAIRGFRMRSFNYVGTTMRVLGEVTGTRVEEGPQGAVGVVEVAVRCEGPQGITVGPGTVEVLLPVDASYNEENTP
ncbi:acyl dehydratase [Nocardioides daejeonensis]|uniref:acyl dehydratase n=1 Tax=Nocardioides daejeonensis TaxID=1046556 RepID=UPI000D744769|nr:acyl dehydratase [Nocardioides daejeonensis]